MATPCVAAPTSYAVVGGGAAGIAPTSSFSRRSTSSFVPHLPPRPLPSASLKLAAGTAFESSRFCSIRVCASSSDETPGSLEVGELFEDLKEKWDAIENKSTVVLYGGGALAAVWLSSVVVGAINSVPVLPKIMELFGLAYTSWFVYRYLLFKSSRKELAEEIEALKKQITGAE